MPNPEIIATPPFPFTAPAYTVRGLSFRYRTEGPPVLDGLTFHLPAGGATAILGPNGAGKSTLLHLLLGLLTPQAGEIRLGDRLLAAYSPEQRSRLVSLVPQREHIPFAFRVQEYLLLGRTPYLSLLAQPTADDQARVAAVLDALGLTPLARRQVNTLSGGERQLVLIARALVQHTPILLLDEPLAHLDPGNRQRVLGLLGRLAAQGRTVIFTTHAPQAAAQIAERVLLLAGGRLLFAGARDEALTSARLSRLYGTPLRVMQIEGQWVVLPGSETDRE